MMNKEAWLVEVTAPFDFGRLVHRAVCEAKDTATAWARIKCTEADKSLSADDKADGFAHSVSVTEIDLISF